MYIIFGWSPYHNVTATKQKIKKLVVIHKYTFIYLYIHLVGHRNILLYIWRPTKLFVFSGGPLKEKNTKDLVQSHSKGVRTSNSSTLMDSAAANNGYHGQ